MSTEELMRRAITDLPETTRDAVLNHVNELLLEIADQRSRYDRLRKMFVTLLGDASTGPLGHVGDHYIVEPQLNVERLNLLRDELAALDAEVKHG